VSVQVDASSSRSRWIVTVCLGLCLGCLMILSSTSFSPFAPVQVGSTILYVAMALSGLVIAISFEDIKGMVVSALLAMLTGVALLAIALSLGLQAVGWTITVDVFLTMVGVHILSYAFTTSIFQAMGAFFALIVKRS